MCDKDVSHERVAGVDVTNAAKDISFLLALNGPYVVEGDSAIDHDYLRTRDALLGVVNSSMLLSADEAAGFFPLSLSDNKSALQLSFVDETECIGCTYCVSIARDTFQIEDEGGKARVFQQGESVDAVYEAIDSCPANCIHFVTRPQLERLEAQREAGESERLWQWRDQVAETAVRLRAADQGPRFPGIDEQRKRMEAQRKREDLSGGPAMGVW